jgi:hypothetical protein
VTYRCRSEIQRVETDVLAIHCSDYRFQAGLREFLDEGLKLQASYDALVVPGGPQCLVELGTLPKFSWASRKWARLLVRLHSLKRLVLIAHQDCGWYRWLEESQPAQLPVRQRQEADLRTARRVAGDLGSGLAIEMYYAGWDDGGIVTLDAVPP